MVVSWVDGSSGLEVMVGDWCFVTGLRGHEARIVRSTRLGAQWEVLCDHLGGAKKRLSGFMTLLFNTLHSGWR